MNNQGEFVDVSNAVKPEILAKLHSTDGGRSDGKTLENTLDKGTNSKGDPVTQPTFEAVDFISYGGLPANSKYFSTLQEVSDQVLNGVRVPFVDGRFRRIVVPKSRGGVPTLPYCYYCTDDTLAGDGDVTFINWMTPSEENKLSGLNYMSQKFKIRASAKEMTQLMAEIQVWSNSYIDKGVRDTRARPSAVLGDWECMLEPDISTTHRFIRTDMIAKWMYGNYASVSPPAMLTIINATDLRDFLNTNGAYWPIPADTLCLALGKIPTAFRGRLSLLGVDVVIDFDSSMTNANGNPVSYNGCQAYEIPKVSSNALDDWVARALNQTFSMVDLQWAIFANTMPLTVYSPSQGIFGGSNFSLNVYTNSVSDQFINFYCTHHDYGHKLPLGAPTIQHFIQAWRVYKTMYASKVCAELGIFNFIDNTQTYGKNLAYQNYYDLISGEFSGSSLSGTPGAADRICWIPYELWIANGANIKMDSEDYVDGQSGVLTNTNYLAPKSEVFFTLTQWSDQVALTSPATVAAYFEPNAGSQIAGGSVPVGLLTSCFQSCMPCTIPRYTSTSDTATQAFEKVKMIDFVYSNSGSNRNTIYRSKLVFGSAAKN